MKSIFFFCDNRLIPFFSHFVWKYDSAKIMNMECHLPEVIWDPFRIHLIHIGKSKNQSFWKGHTTYTAHSAQIWFFDFPICTRWSQNGSQMTSGRWRSMFIIFAESYFQMKCVFVRRRNHKCCRPKSFYQYTWTTTYWYKCGCSYFYPRSHRKIGICQRHIILKLLNNLDY